jgi:polar amino acid transport system permease protein
MTRWDNFVFTFFNARVMAEYLPRIIDGFILTAGLAAMIVASGLAPGLMLAVIRRFRIWSVN